MEFLTLPSFVDGVTVFLASYCFASARNCSWRAFAISSSRAVLFSLLLCTSSSLFEFAPTVVQPTSEVERKATSTSKPFNIGTVADSCTSSVTIATVSSLIPSSSASSPSTMLELLSITLTDGVDSLFSSLSFFFFCFAFFFFDFLLAAPLGGICGVDSSIASCNSSSLVSSACHSLNFASNQRYISVANITDTLRSPPPRHEFLTSPSM